MSTMGPMLKTDVLHDPSSFFQTEWDLPVYALH